MQDFTFEISNHEFNKASLHQLVNNSFVDEMWPIIYIISDDKINEAYIGESINAFARMQNHISNPERRRLSTLKIIGSDKFNKSATLDIESNLIKYVAADGKYKLQNGNSGLVNHNYYQRDKYKELFKALWSSLREEELVINDLETINNSDLFKYSPYKSLTGDQVKSVIEILKSLNSEHGKQIVIEGGAGTGKTILAIYLMKLLNSQVNELEVGDGDLSDELLLVQDILKKKPSLSIGLVVPMTSLRATLKKVFKNIKGLKASMVLGPSDVAKKEYDILLVDEAHRLKRRKNLTSYGSFDNINTKLGLEEQGTELDWILQQSKYQLFFYDEGQSIKPSDIPKIRFDNLKEESEVLKLSSQMRVQGGTGYIQFVHDLLDIEMSDVNQKFDSNEYELCLYDSLDELCQELKQKENEYGLCRIVSGFAWEWQSNKSGNIDIEIDGLELKWNAVTKDWINTPNSVNEVGCIHTTQGYDLNFIGLIFGREIDYDPIKNEIVVDRNLYFDKKGKAGISDEELKDYIINIYKTLMLRGIGYFGVTGSSSLLVKGDKISWI